MRRFWPAAWPYLAGVGGVAAITVLIGALRPWLDLPNLTVAYVLLVLWLGARHGWPPAVSAGLLAFLAYDWFFVPPFGTIYISGPRELLNLVVLLVAALAGGRLASSLAASEAGATAEAEESAILYELATAALRDPAGGAALSLLCDRAARFRGIGTLSLVAAGPDGPEVVAGPPLPEPELARAGRALEAGGTAVDQLERLRTLPPRPGFLCIGLSGGAAVLRPARGRPSAESRRQLAALLGLAGLLLDRRQAVAATERARALEASDRLKAAILSSVSHELKSPLASLRAGLTTLQMPEAGLDGEQRDLIAGLDHQATRLDRLVGDLLTMSRLEAGLAPERTPQDLRELVGTALHGVRPALAPFRVQLELAEELPPVLADELHVERVLTNLLENAAEWAPPGGAIRVGARASGDGVEVWVANDGPAIPPADLERVFEKFWTRRRGGSGLGLAICRRIVEAHGGAIRAENAPGGPRFVFRLVAAAEPAGAGLAG